MKKKLLFENLKFTNLGKLIVFLCTIIITGIPWWVISYQTLSKNPQITFYSILIVAIIAGVLKYFTKHGFWELIFVMISAHQIAYILKIIKDGFEDPSNHNLAPFELILLFIGDFIVCLIFVSLSTLFTKTKNIP